MAAASNGSPTHQLNGTTTSTTTGSPIRHLIVPESTPDRQKVIEAKVVILGAQGVGKTSLVVRNMGGIFSENVNPTIGASFFSFHMIIAGFRVKLQVWDTAGQERFRSMAPMYYRRANAAVIVYDITSNKSFEEARSWVKEVQSKVDSKIAMSVVGNKSDLEDSRQVPRDRGEVFAHTLGAMFTETSASDNIGVKEAFLKVGQGVIELYHNHLLTSTSVSSSFSPFSGTVSPSPPTRDNGVNHVYVYQTHSIGNSSKVVTKKEDEEETAKSSSFPCC